MRCDHSRRLLTLLLVLTCLLTANPSDAADYGRIVSQSYDGRQMVTETHLANGLTILSKEVHAAPVAYFSVWYKVGSRNEISGQTGLSHILEHMMFKGTQDLPPGAIDQLFLANGAQINAETGTDFTHYFELISADRLELAIRVEADRMENSAFDPLQLKHEMVVVRSELEGDSNDPGYQLENFTFLPAEFVAHPYHWPAIGWTADVEAVASHRDVIYRYYKQHYMPNNAVVVMVGDFDTKKAVDLCRKYFGVYPPGQLEHHHITPEPPQSGERRVVLTRPGTARQLIIGFHAPGLGTPDHYVMDVISQILSGGRSARLYQALVETGLCDDVSASNQDCKDPYVFEFDASTRNGVTNAAVETGVEDQIAKLQDSPVSDDELRRAVRQIRASFVYQNDSVADQAEQIGTYAAILNDKYLDTYLTRIAQVSPADIQRVARTYFTADKRTVAYFEPTPLPAGQAPPPPPVVDNFGAPPAGLSAAQKSAVAALNKKFNTGAAPVSAGKRPAPTRLVLPNGLTAIIEESHSNHTVAIAGLVRAGDEFEPAGKWGVASMTAAMLSRGTQTRSELDLALALESVAAGVNFDAGTEDAEFTGGCLSSDLPLTLSVLGDEMLRPAFPADQLEKLRAETLSDLEQSRQDAGGTGGAGAPAQIAFADAIFPPGHPYWEPSVDQSEAAVKSITQDDLRSFYRTYYRPDTTTIVIVGDVRTAAVENLLRSAFLSWQEPASPAPQVTIPTIRPAATAPAAQVLALPGTSQTSILWGFAGQLKRTDPDYYAAYVMNYVLGGDEFASRLGKTIRDENGLAYSVSSGFDASHGAGPFTVFLGANPENAARAIGEVRAIVAEFIRTGATAQELVQAKAYLTGSYPLRLETNAGVAGQLLAAEDYGLGLDYMRKRAGIIESVTLSQVNAAARKYLHPASAALIISGAAPAAR